MQPSSIDLFYTRLPVNEISLSELLVEDHLFYKIPASWHVLITDVKGSTKAIEGGQHETINLLATGSIVAVLNIAYKAGITIPFFFGGDGASFIIPPSLLQSSIQALLKHQENTLQGFGLHLRVGYVPVQVLYEQGETLLVSKLRSSHKFIIPVALGNGLAAAEKIVKGDDYKLRPEMPDVNELDLSGMQCRWDRVQPPVDYDEVVSLLVIARPGVGQASAFKKVIDELDRVYGDPEHRKPISRMRLRMNGSIKKLSAEMKARFGRFQPFYLVRSWVMALLASYYFRTKKGKSYLDQLVEMSDTLVIDGRINTVISGTAEQRMELKVALDELEMLGEIYYGLYVSKESVMSCYVRSINEDHIHFVDGAEGGYTRAAGQLKGKIVL